MGRVTLKRILYHISFKQRFTLKDGWYNKLIKDAPSGFAFFTSTRTTAVSFAGKVKKELNLDNIYVHKVLIHATELCPESAALNGSVYAVIKIPIGCIHDFEVVGTIFV